MNKYLAMLTVVMMLVGPAAHAKGRYPVGYRASCTKNDTTYTSSTVIQRLDLAQLDLLRLRGDGWVCHLERSDDLGKTWCRVSDDGTGEQ